MKLCVQTGPLAGLIAVWLGFSCSGCSFVFSRGPETAPESVTADTNVSCTRSVVWPVIDTVQAGGNAVYMALAASGSGIYGEDYPRDMRGVAVGIHAAAMALSAGSAIYGYYVTSQCRSAHEQKERLRYAGGSADEPLEPLRVVPASPEPVRAAAPRPQPGPVAFALGASKQEAASAR